MNSEIKLNSCHSNKKFADQALLLKICGDILTTDFEIESKDYSNLFCGIFVDGRDRNINSYEDIACIKSFKLASLNNYPVFAFVANTQNFFNNDYNIISDWRINVLKIRTLNSLEDYSDFYIKELFFRIPEKFGGKIENCITLQPDSGFTGKPGFEDFVLNLDVPFIGARFMHRSGLIYKDSDEWYRFNDKVTPFCNGALSYRKVSAMQSVSKKYSNLILGEIGNRDRAKPKEDLFFGATCYCLEDYKQPTIEQCDVFSLDPITLTEWNNKISFGYHCPKKHNEYQNFRDNKSFIF